MAARLQLEDAATPAARRSHEVSHAALWRAPSVLKNVRAGGALQRCGTVRQGYRQEPQKYPAICNKTANHGALVLEKVAARPIT